MKCESCGRELTTLGAAFDRATTKEWRENCAVRLYEVFGQDTFPVYSCSGGIAARKIAYLWRPIAGTKNMEVVAFHVTDKPEQDICAALLKFIDSSRVVDMNGGDMGLPDAI